MHRRARLQVFALSLALLTGCSSPTTSPDAGRADAAPAIDAFAALDAGATDAAIAEDAAVTRDASAAPDAGTDAGGGPNCDAAVLAIESAAANVWFLSESDRPLEVQVFEGEGASAPTEATVVRLAASPAGATRSTRATDGFAMHFEPAPGAPDPAPSVLEAAIAAGLTDLIYVAIIEDPTMSAEVRVILAGRTDCGDLVFVESVSIET